MSAASDSTVLRSCTSGAAATSRGRRSSARVSVITGAVPASSATTYGSRRRAKSSGASIRRCAELMASAFLMSNRAVLRRHLRHVERLDHLGEGEHIAVGRSGTDRERPAEKGQIVEQAFRDEAAVAVEEQVRLRVALGELAVALAGHQRQMRRTPGAPLPIPTRASASYSAICRGVDGSRSSPRRTWVIPISASSTGFTSG